MNNINQSNANAVEKNKPFLVIKNVVKDFSGVKAVNDVSVTINQGEIFALLGSSGCGKSTLLRMLAGFEVPTSGSIIMDGIDMVPIPAYERPINMMFQSYALFPHLSVIENVAFGLKREGLPRGEVYERAEKMLSLVQLSKYAQRKPHELSGGQQQRVALARSLAKRPRLLLLDEPLGALDKKLREQTQLELVTILEQVGVTCVMVTHDQEEAMTMATRIAVMSQGVIQQIGKPSEIYERPTSRFVADFIGNINLFDVKPSDVSDPALIAFEGAGIKFSVDKNGQAINVNTDYCLGIRPEKMYIAKQLPTKLAVNPVNVAQGEVTEMAYMGSYTTYHIKLSSGFVLKLSMTNVDRESDLQVTWGDKVYVYWSSDAVVVLEN